MCTRCCPVKGTSARHLLSDAGGDAGGGMMRAAGT